jgi:plastocyanin
MRKYLLGTICFGGLSMAALLLWEPSVRAEGDITTVEIVTGEDGPVLAPPNVTISVGQTVKWVPKTPPGVPHRMVNDATNENLTDQFTNPVEPTRKFETAGIIKYHCFIHPTTMVGTITVK